MACMMIVIEHYEPMSCGQKSLEKHGPRRKSLGKHPSEPPFRLARVIEAMAAGCQRKGSNETMAIAVFEVPLDP